jgi:hypothetical protein
MGQKAKRRSSEAAGFKSGLQDSHSAFMKDGLKDGKQAIYEAFLSIRPSK